MGIAYETEKFLNATIKHGVDCTSTLMLGRQSFRIPVIGYAEDYFRSLGATLVDSMDVNDYEGATILHDLNHAPKRIEGYSG